jgi:hypothetical protein
MEMMKSLRLCIQYDDRESPANFGDLAQREALAAVGSFATELAHEFAIR